MTSRSLLQRLFVALLVGTTSAASAAGYYNMPTSLRQCLGMGFGPGYHAPLLLGPSLKAGTATKPVTRLPMPLAPPATAGFTATPTLFSGAEFPYVPTGMTEQPVSPSLPAESIHPAAMDDGTTIGTPIRRTPSSARTAPIFAPPTQGEIIPLPQPTR